MSEYYKGKRTKNVFDPESRESFALSRSKIDLFIECPRCFYLDRRLGVGRPPGYPFSLNSAVDTLLKKEFDVHRAKGDAHPLMKQYGIKAVPFAHKDLNIWRENFKGIRYHHVPTNLTITGAVDDVWIDADKKLHIVDYKATSKTSEVNLDAEWQDGYKRQMEVYQWLFTKNDFEVSDTGYFVYCNGKTDRGAFDGKLEFDVVIIPYTGKMDWIEKTIFEIQACLLKDTVPEASEGCDYCCYRDATEEVLGGTIKKESKPEPKIKRDEKGKSLFE